MQEENCAIIVTYPAVHMAKLRRICARTTRTIPAKVAYLFWKEGNSRNRNQNSVVLVKNAPVYPRLWLTKKLSEVATVGLYMAVVKNSNR